MCFNSTWMFVWVFIRVIVSVMVYWVRKGKWKWQYLIKLPQYLRKCAYNEFVSFCFVHRWILENVNMLQDSYLLFLPLLAQFTQYELVLEILHRLLLVIVMIFFQIYLKMFVLSLPNSPVPANSDFYFPTFNHNHPVMGWGRRTHCPKGWSPETSWT